MSAQRRRRILLVEDERAVARPVIDRLEAEGFEVEHVRDGDTALSTARRSRFDLILLDIMLPGRVDGYEVARTLRAGEGSDVPVLMVTARSDVADRVSGLRVGADDYLVKPFAMAELIARIEALLRRAGHSSSRGGVVRFGGVEVDLDSGVVTRDGEPIELPAREFVLLRYFLEHQGQVLSRERLLKDVWGYPHVPVSRTVDVHVARLRERLEPDRARPRHFLTLRGRGYRFVPAGTGNP